MINYNLYQGDCIELMKEIPDKSIDMILCDLPYGGTRCTWDIVISFEELWKHYHWDIGEVLDAKGNQMAVPHVVKLSNLMLKAKRK